MFTWTLEDTAERMCSKDYKDRFVAEYVQTKIRYEKLRAFCNKIEAAQIMKSEGEIGNVEEPLHDCPLDMLRKQQYVMGQYLQILELRAVIEGIDL